MVQRQRLKAQGNGYILGMEIYKVVKLCTQLANPEFVLQRHPYGEVLVMWEEIRPLSKYQLYIELLEDGWTHKVLDMREKRTNAPAFNKRNKNTLFWERESGKGFTHAYLAVLLFVSRAPRLEFEDLHVQHFQN